MAGRASKEADGVHVQSRKKRGYDGGENVWKLRCMHRMLQKDSEGTECYKKTVKERRDVLQPGLQAWLKARRRPNQRGEKGGGCGGGGGGCGRT